MSGATPEGHTPLTPAVFHVLLALSDGPLHGYAIMRRVEEESGIEMGPGTVYGSLQRMEDAGLVREADLDDEDARRRSYRLTDDGRSALRAEAVRLNRLAALTRERRLVPEGDLR
ncbi:MAG TPA: PadR family transcriptional regulator [Longimicrobiales bacterium]|nr:PadR family transcriptional regulator [Longimicrobiales bacterium]